MRLYDLLDGAKIERPKNIDNIEITSIVTDSRRAVKGSMFICIDGFRYDGHNYIKNAVDAAVAAIVKNSKKKLPLGFNVLENE